jgi:hypothetical protein
METSDEPKMETSNESEMETSDEPKMETSNESEMETSNESEMETTSDIINSLGLIGENIQRTYLITKNKNIRIYFCYKAIVDLYTYSKMLETPIGNTIQKICEEHEFKCIITDKKIKALESYYKRFQIEYEKIYNDIKNTFMFLTHRYDIYEKNFIFSLIIILSCIYVDDSWNLFCFDGSDTDVSLKKDDLSRISDKILYKLMIDNPPKQISLW